MIETIDGVKVWQDGRAGRVVLDRPEALNALDPAMLKRISFALDRFSEVSSRVHLVVVEGAGGRAFCAGGDVRAIRDAALAGDHVTIERFFAAEYGLDLAIARYEKPWVSLIDGICMGGGLGLAVHGMARVATDHAVIAMPETGIALFPDVGTAYALPRLPGAIGTYMALTGTRMVGADAVHAGLATHYVTRARLPDLVAALAKDGYAVLAAFAEKLPPFSLAPHRAAIDRCFGVGSVAEIIAALEAEPSDWGRDTLSTLRRMSPSAVHWSFQHLRRGEHETLTQVLHDDLQMARWVTLHPDFAEGVRAMVIDKDRKPRWSPARIEDVDPHAIATAIHEGRLAPRRT
ncbi:MAG TPA: enoyl-CoA hydratase/isomerase family protein [Acidisphaera sp.]|nr:enoyl-CoA hydratase/isomerase family protein [Acidisphaera sp.]